MSIYFTANTDEDYGPNFSNGFGLRFARYITGKDEQYAGTAPMQAALEAADDLLYMAQRDYERARALVGYLREQAYKGADEVGWS